MAALEMQFGANVQPALNGIKQVESALTSFSSKIKAAAGNTNALPPAIDNTTKALAKVAPASNAANVALINTGRVLQDLPFGIIGVANNINPLLESFQRLKAETGSTKLALSSLAGSLLGGGGLGLAVSAITAALTFATIGFSFFNRGMKETKKETDDTKKSVDEFKQAVDGIVKSSANEAAEVAGLVAVLKSETETRQRKLGAIKELNNIAPESFNALKLEGDAVVGLDNAYKNYLLNLKTVIAVKVKQLQLETLIKQQLEEQGQTLTASERQTKSQIDSLVSSLDKISGQTQKARFLKFDAKLQRDKLQNDINTIIREIEQLSSGVKIKATPKIDPNKTKDEIDDFTAAFKFSGKAIEVPLEPLIDPPSFFERFKKELKKIQDLLVLPVKLEITGVTPKSKEVLDKKQLEQDFQDALAKAKSFSAKLDAAVNFDKISESVANAAKAINATLTPAFENLFDAIIKGEDPLKAFFGSLIQSIERLISKLVAAIAVAAILNAIFPGLGGAIGGGAKGFLGIFKGLFGFASGGLVSGSTLAVVGERSTASNPEVIAPLDRLRSIIGGGAGNNVVVSVDGVIRGNDLALLAARTSRSQNRTMGRG